MEKLEIIRNEKFELEVPNDEMEVLLDQVQQIKSQFEILESEPSFVSFL